MFRDSQLRSRDRGTGLDAECDDPDWTHAERGEDQREAGTERAVRFSGIQLRTTSHADEWSRVSRGESVEEEHFQVAAESGRCAGALARGTVDRGTGSPESRVARVVELLRLWDAADGLSSGRLVRLQWRSVFSAAPTQGAHPRQHSLLGCSCIREVGRAAIAGCAPWAPSVSLR